MNSAYIDENYCTAESPCDQCLGIMERDAERALAERETAHESYLDSRVNGTY